MNFDMVGLALNSMVSLANQNSSRVVGDGEFVLKFEEKITRDWEILKLDVGKREFLNPGESKEIEDGKFIIVDYRNFINEFSFDFEYDIVPVEIIEYDDEHPIESSPFRYKFSEQSMDGRAWGQGIQTTETASKVLQENGKKSVNEFARIKIFETQYFAGDDVPLFTSKVYTTNKRTLYSGLLLEPNSMSIVYSFGNYTKRLENSQLALRQLLLSTKGAEPATVSIGDLDSDSMSRVLIDPLGTLGNGDTVQIDVIFNEETTNLAAKDLLYDIKNVNDVKEFIIFPKTSENMEEITITQRLTFSCPSKREQEKNKANLRYSERQFIFTNVVVMVMIAVFSLFG